MGAGRFDQAAGGQKQFFAVDGTRTGDDPGTISTDLLGADRDPRVARSELAVGELEWLRDGYHLGNARSLDKEVAQGEWIRADDADYGALVRSEERRVGKECRGRGARYNEK